LTTSPTTPTGVYTVTVSGIGTSATHTATYTLTVTALAAAITNGGFETGTFSGWTVSGATSSVTTTGPHGGTYAALLGATPATNGDASAAQTFTAPVGSGFLAFWYNVTCNDTIAFDWATATLKDNTAGTTATVLPKTCVASSGWNQITAPVTAGHSYTLTLTNHDDNDPKDPTYTKYDDVTLKTSTVPIVNGGFETGTLSGWTPSGASSSVTTTGPHSGTYAAMLGATTATNGDASVAQTFTVPTGSSLLSFWYAVSCMDAVAYDWATATLVDNTAGTTATVLPKTCPTSSGWNQVTATLTAGHSYTLTLTNHDDNDPKDPTYTKYDDVTVT
jgi:hypothetical protein